VFLLAALLSGAQFFYVLCVLLSAFWSKLNNDDDDDDDDEFLLFHSLPGHVFVPLTRNALTYGCARSLCSSKFSCIV